MTTAPPHDEHSAVSVRTLAVALASVSFIVSYLIALHLYDLRVYEHSDVWFEADTNFFMVEFARFPVIDARHPTLSLVVYSLASALARGITTLGVTSAAVPDLREWLALLVAPVASAIRTMLLFGLFRRLIGRVGPAVLLVVLDMAASATVILGGIPESYGLTAACLAAMYWLVLDDAIRPRGVRDAQWLLLGAAAIGVTITNVIPLALLRVAALRRIGAPPRRALVGALAVTVGAVMLTAALAFGGSRRFIAPELSVRTLEITQSVLHPVNTVDVSELAMALSHVFVAPAPARSDNRATRRENPDFGFIFWYRGPPVDEAGSLWRGLLTIAMLILGAVGFAQRRSAAPLALVALGIIGCNVFMHLVWGWHYFVYALHWQTSLLVLIAGLALWNRRGRTAGDLILAGFVLVTVVNSWLQLRHLLAQLATA